jgi:hypothetical protein
MPCSTTACPAVGYYENSSGTVTLAEVWNCTALEHPDDPESLRRQISLLNGVSVHGCRPHRRRVFENVEGIAQTLAEANR